MKLVEVTLFVVLIYSHQEKKKKKEEKKERKKKKEEEEENGSENGLVRVRRQAFFGLFHLILFQIFPPKVICGREYE